jgi:tRNA/rRNA methyltransferase
MPASFVLVDPRGEANVGSAARALKNNGFFDLRLVQGVTLGDEARRMACGSEDVLDAIRRFASLPEAIGDASLVVGFTARDRRDLREALWLDDAIPRIVDVASTSSVALVFGREDRGLTAQELAPCHLIVTIPAAIERPVYNLAQAVLLAAYTLRRALGSEPAPKARTQFARESSLTAAELAVLSTKLRETLVVLGYDGHPDRGLIDRIVARAGVGFARAVLDGSDRDMLLGVLRRTLQVAERAGPTPWGRASDAPDQRAP